jgi:hypothetical protein
VEPLDLYKVGDLMIDAAKFVRAELSRIATTHGLGNADEEWAEEKEVVRKSQGQMVYVSTVIRHIDDPYGNPRQLLKDIINNSSATSPDISHSTPFSSLYELYAQIMRSCPHRNRAVLMEVLGDTLSNLIFEDNTCEAALGQLDRFCGRPLGCGVKTLRPLHAVLRHRDSAERISIGNMFVHSSFTEFLRSPHASGDFYVNVRKRQAWILSKMLDCMPSITFEDVIENKLDDIASFSSMNFWSLHNAGLVEFFESKTTYMTKLISVDLRACIIDYFYYDVDPIFSSLRGSMMPSRYLTSFIDLDRCEDVLSTAVHEVNSHWQSSFEDAFLFMLQPNISLGSLQFSTWAMASDCVDYYLHEVATQSDDWREHKLIQALGAPGPEAFDLFEEVVQCLYHWLDAEAFYHIKRQEWDCEISGEPENLWFEEAVDQLCEPLNEDQQWAWDILEYLYEVMARDHNPILEAEYHPFTPYLCIQEKRRARAVTQDMLPPILDVA